MKTFIALVCAVAMFGLETLGGILCVACVMTKRNPLDVIAKMLV